MKRYFFLLLLVPVTTWAQVKVYPLERRPSAVKQVHTARQEAPHPVSLPFWDDFSFAEDDHPIDTLWINNDNVLVNEGQALNPPTINAATFDGLNENGQPYNSTDPLDNGYRDTLVSQTIKMTEIEFNNFQDSVFLSFYYQGGGNVETPNPNDFLTLEFKDENDIWVTIATLRTGPGFDPAIFYYAIFQVNDDRYYHDEFQFRFISFGRKSGNYDGWHIDYVYLNEHRYADQDAFPDRSFYTSLSPLFAQYYTVPKTHFDSNPGENTTLPQFGLSNLNDAGEPKNYTILLHTSSYEDEILTEQSSVLQNSVPASLGPSEKKMFTLATAPDLSTYSSADSVFVTLTLALDDDSSAKGFGSVNFNLNDTLRQSYRLTDHYAYDDGEAEYSAGLTDSGNELAYRFIMRTPAEDIINGLQIYFPYFGGTSPSSMEIFVLNDRNGLPDNRNVLYRQAIPVRRTANNLFSIIDFNKGVQVQDTFYIGYHEPSVGRVRIGLDKSNDTGAHLYSRISSSGNWEQNDRVTGSLMIRPRFGEADVVTGIPENRKPLTLYPNPNAGEFYIQGEPVQLSISTITGQSVPFKMENLGEDKKISLYNTLPGLYIVRYRSGTKVFSEKIIIKK